MAIYQEKDRSKWTKDGRSWYYRTYDKNGKQKESKKYFSKAEAKEEEALFILLRDNPLKKDFLIVAKGYFDNLEETKKASTVYTYKKDYNKHIRDFFSPYSIHEIDARKIAEWAEIMKKKNISVAYMNKCKNILKGIFEYAIINFGLNSNPADIKHLFQEKRSKVIKDEEKIKYITLDLFNQFVNAVDDDIYYAFFMTAYYTGCRKGELQALTWKDVDIDNEVISINKTLYELRNGTAAINSTKNNQNRKIKMSKTLKSVLLDHKSKMMQYSNYSDEWFVFGNVTYLKKTTISRKKDYYFELSGIPKEKRITMHQFRHSHVSLLVNEYVSKCQKLNIKIDTYKFFLMMSSRMGHTVDVMQRTYMHLFPAIQDEIVDLLDNL